MKEDSTISIVSILNKLEDLNERTEGSYTILLKRCFMVLNNFNNSILVTRDPQELSEFMYRIILKENK